LRRASCVAEGHPFMGALPDGLAWIIHNMDL
jgi:hypothetical protein